MDIIDLLSTTPETLAERQEKALVEATIAHLQGVIDLLKKREYKEVELMLSHSSAGDDCGQDNDYIDFGHLLPGKDENDIGAVVRRLEALRRVQEPSPPKVSKVPKRGGR